MSRSKTVPSISIQSLNQSLDTLTVIDVRRETARQSSGQTILGAKRRLPDEVQEWASAFSENTIVVFCVHGHEVSQTVCDELRQRGIDAYYLEDGFEAWLANGLPAQPLDPML